MVRCASARSFAPSLRSLCVKIREGAYGAFRNEVAAQAGKKITEANATVLLRMVSGM